MDATPPAHRIHAHHHAVQFYSRDTELFKTIATFLSEGLVSGQPAVVIATQTHAADIVSHLAAKFIDVAAARRLGDLVMLDADETLASFMVNGMPDAGLFSRNVGVVIEQAVRGREHTLVRAYGEMVDVLWKEGTAEAAIRLEVLWNELASQYSFSLLCGCAIGSFYKQTAQFDEVCQHHTHVSVEDTNVVPFPLPKASAE